MQEVLVRTHARSQGSLIGGMGYWGENSKPHLKLYNYTSLTPPPKQAMPSTVESLTQATVVDCLADCPVYNCGPG